MYENSYTAAQIRTTVARTAFAFGIGCSHSNHKRRFRVRQLFPNVLAAILLSMPPPIRLSICKGRSEIQGGNPMSRHGIGYIFAALAALALAMPLAAHN